MATYKIHVHNGVRGQRFRIRYDYVDATTGTRKQPWETLPAGSTRNDADAQASAKIADILRGSSVSHSQRTLKELLIEWLKQDARHHVEPTTFQHYESTVRLHLIPELGHHKVQKLQPALLAQWQNQYRAAGRGTRTVQLAHLRLQQALSYAVRMGYIERNPLQHVKMPHDEPKEVIAWTGEQAAQFLSAAPKSVYHPIWHFMLGTGVRRGEALGLRWADLDMDAHICTINQTIVLLDGHWHRKEPKTAHSRRGIPLTRSLISMLKTHRARQAERILKLDHYQNHDLIFASQNGTPINPNNITREFERVCGWAKIEPITVHGLRHTAATLALEGGEPLEVVKQLLGHQRISTTADIYARVRPAATARAVNTIYASLHEKTQRATKGATT